MFGYVTINKETLSAEEYQRFRAQYCGLCHVLAQRYGKVGRAVLSYDMAFLSALLASLYEPEERAGEERCGARPAKPHAYVFSEATEYAADMNLLLTYYKCMDDWEDERKLWKLAYGKMLEGKSKGVKETYAAKVRNICLLMHDFYDAEKTGNGDIDTMAGLFGKIMAEIFVCREDEWSEGLGRFGFFLGKFIYLSEFFQL